MKRSEGDRATVMNLHEQGFSPSKIQKMCGMKFSLSFVYKTIKRYNETNSLKDRARIGRPRSKSTARAIALVKGRIRRNPRRSVRKLAKDLQMSKSTAHRIIRQHLKLKAYKRVQVQMLSDTDKKRRRQKAKALLQRFTDDDVKQIIFSDEKMFTVAEKVNKQNDRLYAASKDNLSPAVLKVRKAEFPAKIMVWGAVCSKGPLKLKFVDPGTKVNTEYYKNDILSEVLLPEASRLFPTGNWCFQQDGAPSHTSRATQAWLKAHTPAFITKEEWPAKSPDLNPLDYSIWGILESKVNIKSHTSIEFLKKAIQREWAKLSEETCAQAVQDWRRRLRACCKAKGDHFEL